MFHRAFVCVPCLFILATCVPCSSPNLTAQELDIEAAKKEAEAAIMNEIKSYVAAFNAKDSKKLASHWSPRGVYSSRTTGNLVVGHEALQKEFDTIFKEADNLKLEVTTEEIEFISPSVAIEHGIAKVSQAGTENVEKSEYSAVFVNRDGRWLIDRISDNLVVKKKSHYEQLKELEWLVGTWVDKAGDSTIEFECKWTQNKNHISRAYRVVTDDNVQHTGLQIIGWDPKNKRIRSWLFDSDGGYVEGTWKKDGKRWVIMTTGTLPDGGTGTAVNYLRNIDGNSFGYQKTKQVIDGAAVPDADEIIVQRKK